MDYDIYLSSQLRDNEKESLYRLLMYINRLDVPCDVKHHMGDLLKIRYQNRKMKGNMDKVIKEIQLYQYYSWGLFKASDNITIIEEDLKSVP